MRLDGAQNGKEWEKQGTEGGNGEGRLGSSGAAVVSWQQ